MVASLLLADEAATLTFGQTLASVCGGRGFFTLSGQLGAGKTTLCRGLIQALGHGAAVKSPTYTLVEPYELPGGLVLHYDLYRLGDPQEFCELGFEEQLGGDSLVLVEWPEQAGRWLPTPDLALTLAQSSQGRRLTWQGLTPRGRQLDLHLQQHYRGQPTD
jgi:tRNA threonylcarbamoyladenosine biosynthesis protein TsaE